MVIIDVTDNPKFTERTIYRIAGAKKIPAFKMGGSWRFPRVDIDIWIRQLAAPVQGREEQQLWASKKLLVDAEMFG